MVGAIPVGGGRCRFRVWAPSSDAVAVHVVSPEERWVPLKPAARGYHEATVEDLAPGSRYLYRLDGGRERPDPASRSQPEGVHGPSEVVDLGAVPWSDGAWRGVALRDLILYELHVGTFTREGTFEAVIPHLPGLRDLGVTAIELMPVAQFPGRRGWGYDGAHPYAAQQAYGGAAGLGRLVDACHRAGLAVLLDVVYNHLGPEGNYLAEFGPYFSDTYRIPWGPAINFDGPGSDEVRHYFIGNALHWLVDLHLDGLRLDAVHAIHDMSAQPFLAELAGVVARRKPGALLIAESDLNDPRLIRPPAAGGDGLDAQWSDDFHHALHGLLTGERDGYYGDFGRVEHLGRALAQGYTYTGQYSGYRGRRHGAPPRECAGRRFVVYAQNHDQVGNRAQGDRLAAGLSPAQLQLAAAVVLLSPFTPLLFMGEEYGETAPFQFFTDYGDAALQAAVGPGRRAEFARFDWAGEVPDPQDRATYDRSVLRRRGQAGLRDFYKELMRLRRSLPALATDDLDSLEVVPYEARRALFVRRWAEGDEVCLVFSFSPEATDPALPVPAGRWQGLLGCQDLDSGGEVRLTLAPWSAILLRRTA